MYEQASVTAYYLTKKEARREIHCYLRKAFPRARKDENSWRFLLEKWVNKLFPYSSGKKIWYFGRRFKEVLLLVDDLPPLLWVESLEALMRLRLFFVPLPFFIFFCFLVILLPLALSEGISWLRVLSTVLGTPIRPISPMQGLPVSMVRRNQ